MGDILSGNGYSVLAVFYTSFREFRKTSYLLIHRISIFYRFEY